MIIKEQISEYIKQLDELKKNYDKKLYDHINSINKKMTKNQYYWQNFDTNGIGREIENRLEKIKYLRRFLYALKNYDLPLYKKILRNTLTMLGITSGYMLVIATFAAALISSIAITCIAPATPIFLLYFTFSLGTFLAGMAISILGTFAAIIFREYLEKQIIPIWNDNDFKQEYEKINVLVHKSHKCFTKDVFDDTVIFAKDIVLNLEQPSSNISALLLKKEEELIKLPLAEVVTENDSENKQSLHNKFPLLELHMDKCDSLIEFTTDIEQDAMVDENGNTFYVRGDMSQFNKTLNKKM